MIRPAPGLTLAEQPEPVCVVANLWSEARGEPALGRLAVLCVVATRADKRDTSLKAQVLAKAQFSWTLDDALREKALTAWRDDPAGWAKCCETYELWEAKATVDPTMGSWMYYAPSAASPAWGRGHPEWEEAIVIANHVFGRAPW